MDEVVPIIADKASGVVVLAADELEAEGAERIGIFEAVRVRL